MKRYRTRPRLHDVWVRFNDLKLATRISIGFGIAGTLVMVLALIGVGALYGVTRDVDVFSATSDASQAAADVDIGVRSLEVAVRDHLAEGDSASLDQARARRDGVLSILGRLDTTVDTAADRAALVDMRAALAGYWTGFERIVAVRDERNHLLTEEIEGLVQSLRQRLDHFRASGGIDSATLASDIAIALTRMQDHLVRFAERRDAVEGERMHKQLAHARDRLSEMNRYLWVPGTRQSIAECEALLSRVATALDRVDELLVEEDAVRADALMPNAAIVAERADEVRQRTDAVAARLRGEIAANADGYVTVSLWIGGGMLALGLGLTWFVARSVGRPMGAMASAVTAIADGRSDVAVPAVAGNDEVGALARAVRTLRANTEEMDRLRRQAEAMHADLSDAKDRAEAANLAKTHFLVKMGHELHGPVGDMIARGQSLMTDLHGLGLGHLANDAEGIQWSGEQLLGLIDSILDYAKIEAGTMDVCLQAFDVGRLLTEVRERSMPAADLNGNGLVAVAAPGLGTMHSDFTKVRQILLNLLDNACAYTQGGDIRLTAERVEVEGRPWVRFTVTDTGAGFPVSQTGRLFQPFVRGTQSGTGRRRGAGLGLTLVAHYTDMLGGDIEVASSPGQGTRIAVALPADHAQTDGERTPRLDAGREARPRPMLTMADTAAAP